MLNKIKKDNKGFTIIEVLIVLAIAGLIMLVVFLAVPALQRSSRNTQREADATKVSAAMAACLANRNGTVTSCDSSAELVSNGGLDLTKLQQLTTVNYLTGGVIGAPGDTKTITFGFGSICKPEGDTAISSTSTRQGAMVYRIELANAATVSPRCLDV